MTTNSKGLNLIKHFEGCKLTAYKDIAGIWTIGYGHTKGVTEGMGISQATADSILKEDLKEFEGYVSQYVKVKLTSNQFSALVSFAFNLGPRALRMSTLLKLLNRSDYHGAMLEFPKWCKSRGRLIPGLLRRRLAEQELFNTLV